MPERPSAAARGPPPRAPGPAAWARSPVAPIPTKRASQRRPPARSEILPPLAPALRRRLVPPLQPARRAPPALAQVHGGSSAAPMTSSASAPQRERPAREEQRLERDVVARCAGVDAAQSRVRVGTWWARDGSGTGGCAPQGPRAPESASIVAANGAARAAGSLVRDRERRLAAGGERRRERAPQARACAGTGGPPASP